MKIDDDNVEKVCKPGTEKACSYITISADGWYCAKDEPSIKEVIDNRLLKGNMRAKCNNCSGPPDFKPTVVN